MPFFKKKQESVEKTFDLPELPSFPEVEEIKQAINPRESNGIIPPLPPLLPSPAYAYPVSPMQAQPLQKPDIKKTEELGTPSWNAMPSQGPTVPLTRELESPSRATPISAQQVNISRTEASARIPKSREPIFIKIDKFSEALSNFEVIKKRIDEIDDLLKKTREIRQKEQEEFDAWEKEIVEIREKVNNIDSKLFSKIE